MSEKDWELQRKKLSEWMLVEGDRASMGNSVGENGAE